jgi:hypothetical protein
MSSASQNQQQQQQQQQEPPTKRARGGGNDGNGTTDNGTGADALGAAIRKAAEDLERDGYAVVPDIFTSTECATMQAEMWGWMEQTTQGRVSRKDDTTWGNTHWVPNSHRLVHQYRVGHSRPVWRARTNRNAIRVFAELADAWTIWIESGTFHSSTLSTATFRKISFASCR